MMDSSKAIVTTGAAKGYRRLGRRRLLLLVAAAGLLLVTLLVDLMTGPAMLSASEVLSAILRPEQVAPAHRVIVWTFRMPTALFALLIGASLGIAGSQMQTILDNPLASPYTLGVSAAASFGAALALVFGAAAVPLTAALLVPASAFACAMLCSLAVYGVAHARGGSSESIILVGVALLFLFNSGVAFLQYVASEDQLRAIVFWIFGSLQGATWIKLVVVGAVLALALPLLVVHAWKTTALRLGEDHARSLGVNVPRLRLEILVIVSVLTAAAVCFAGAIGFIGLVGPHIARMSVGEDQRYFMPLSGLVGALLLSVASIASKLVVVGTIFPIGIATAFIGVPLFATMVVGHRRAHW